jgi:hypothetical protein
MLGFRLCARSGGDAITTANKQAANSQQACELVAYPPAALSRIAVPF